MATAQCAAVLLVNIETLFTVPRTKLARDMSASISNGGAAQHTVYLVDSFTPDASIGQTSPTTQNIEIGEWVVPANTTLLISHTDMKEKEVRGTLKGYAEAAEPLCITTVDYKLE